MAVVVDGWELPDHVSYSSLTTYLDCGWMYVLTRGAKVAERPSCWLTGGSAVHEATEQLDREWWEESKNA